jgi:hypothetical protein
MNISFTSKYGVLNTDIPHYKEPIVETILYIFHVDKCIFSKILGM